MILYLDSSALVKRYLTEARSAEVERVIVTAEQIGTAIITRAEVSAAIAKAVRMKWVEREEALKSLTAFQAQWPSMFRLRLSELTVERADTLAWAHGLRGYDAVHVACALLWQESLSDPITFATFDEQQWDVAQKLGLAVWPEAL
jgi:predicted nucleic acid-binding protein